MRTSREALNYRVVVRRVATGLRCFQWEVLGADDRTPIQVSADRFRGMQTAYEEGQAWLVDLLAKQQPPLKRSAPWEIAEDFAPSTAAPLDGDLDDEDDDTVAGDDAFGHDADTASEAAIGIAAPVHPSGIG